MLQMLLLQILLQQYFSALSPLGITIIFTIWQTKHGEIKANNAQTYCVKHHHTYPLEIATKPRFTILQTYTTGLERADIDEGPNPKV